MHQSSSVFTLSDTDTETETDEMATVPNGISVSEQSEHLHTILYSPFLSVMVLASVFASVNAPLLYHKSPKYWPPPPTTDYIFS